MLIWHHADAETSESCWLVYQSSTIPAHLLQYYHVVLVTGSHKIEQNSFDAIFDVRYPSKYDHNNINHMSERHSFISLQISKIREEILKFESGSKWFLVHYKFTNSVYEHSEKLLIDEYEF